MSLLFILVGIGGGLGAMARFGLTQATASISKQIPLGIFLCNVIGSFFIGLIAAWLVKTNLFSEEVSVSVRALIVSGFLGGFTTFSSFSLDTLNLLQRGEIVMALSYIVISVLVALLAVVLGFYTILAIYR